MVDFEIGGKLKISLFSTLSYSLLFPGGKGGAVEIMRVLGGSCPSNMGNRPQGNCPTGVMVLGG